MRVKYLTNAEGTSGVGHRADAVAARLPGLDDVKLERLMVDGQAGKIVSAGGNPVSLTPWPGMLGSKSVNWVRLGGKIKDDRPDVWHFTNQSLSFLASKLSPSVVTVHDIIEVQEPQDWRAQWLNKYLYSGIKQADQVVAVSQYTAEQVQSYYSLSPEKVTVIYNGVDTSLFRPLSGFAETVGYLELRQDLKLGGDDKVVLYVGSDHPRKNVIGTAQVVARLRESWPNVVLIKVGQAGLPAGREELLAEIDRMGMRDAVRFVKAVSNHRLNELYNLADVLLYPSRFEGFGFPPLQAMAAGTPVVTSNVTSLPEVTGDDGEYGEKAALVHNPDDVESMARSIRMLFEDVESRDKLTSKGLTRAKQFSWEKTAQQIVEAYQGVAHLSV